jgi:uncharacterized protein YjeT (DUF2065 family)
LSDLATALALVLVIEGTAYALFPEGMQRAIRAVLDLELGRLRMLGLVAAGLGLALVWLIRMG